jgi:hypothetical protein
MYGCQKCTTWPRRAEGARVMVRVGVGRAGLPEECLRKHLGLAKAGTRSASGDKCHFTFKSHIHPSLNILKFVTFPLT